MNFSYHDVKVYVGNKCYLPSENYALELTCCKSSGWRLWERWNEKSVLIGGEYDATPFCIEVGSIVVCGEKPKTIEQIDHSEFGWDGTFDTNKNKVVEPTSS